MNLSTNLKFTLLFIDIILFKSFITVYVTPYTALGAELSSDYHERTTVQSIKTIFFSWAWRSSLLQASIYYFNLQSIIHMAS